LDRLRGILAELGNPQQEFPSIVVVGTNGKGSTAAMLEAVLREHGMSTGLYTSPHLVRVEERIRLSGRMVAEAVLNGHLRRIEPFVDLTYFEALTAAAFAVFAEAGVDVAVLEAGMGGSWDATRLAQSSIAGLTNVGSDHPEWLGSKRAQIAGDKGQALAAADYAVLGPGVTGDVVSELGAPLAVPAVSLLDVSSRAGNRARVTWDGGDFEVVLPLPGAHQIENLHLALGLALEASSAGLFGPLEAAKVRTALADFGWPGRLSRHWIDGREVLLDCAHNEEAARSLARYLEGADQRYNLLFSCLADKPVLRMAEVLRPLVGEVGVCQLVDERALPIDRLVDAFPGARVASSPLQGLKLLEDPVLVAGSLRLVGALLADSSEAEDL
jgi:dihydrofolate synthase/folylpolyglutamate synthase